MPLGPRSSASVMRRRWPSSGIAVERRCGAHGGCSACAPPPRRSLSGATAKKPSRDKYRSDVAGRAVRAAYRTLLCGDAGLCAGAVSWVGGICLIEFQYVDEHGELGSLHDREAEPELPNSGSSLDFLQAVYRCEVFHSQRGCERPEWRRPLSTHLAVTAVVHDQSNATRLERAVQRSDRVRSQLKVIEHQPSDCLKQNGDGLKTDLTLRPLVPDRRFRRRA
jgi:hypothetical protein